MQKKCLSATAALVAGVVLAVAGPASAAGPRCGAPAQGAATGAAPVRADLTPVVADHVVTLGRGTEGSRRWEVEFTWTAECVLEAGDIRPMISTFQGSDSSLDAGVVALTSVVDSDARSVRVTLAVPRDPKKVPAGKFEGRLVVGSGSVGRGEAGVTIRHQEPLTVNRMNPFLEVVWVVLGLLVAGALFGAQRLADWQQGRTAKTDSPDRRNQDFTTPLGVIIGALALYPLLARIGGAQQVPWPAWPVWLGAAGLLGGVIVGIVKHRDSSQAVALVGGQRFATALLLSFGAGITAWRAQYLNTPDWALTVESALALLGVVGGATATTALLFLSPNPKPPDQPTDLKPEADAVPVEHREPPPARVVAPAPAGATSNGPAKAEGAPVS